MESEENCVGDGRRDTVKYILEESYEKEIQYKACNSTAKLVSAALLLYS